MESKGIAKLRGNLYVDKYYDPDHGLVRNAGHILHTQGIHNIYEFAEAIDVPLQTVARWCHDRPKAMFLIIEGFKALGLDEQLNHPKNPKHFVHW